MRDSAPMRTTTQNFHAVVTQVTMFGGAAGSGTVSPARESARAQGAAPAMRSGLHIEDRAGTASATE